MINFIALIIENSSAFWFLIITDLCFSISFVTVIWLGSFSRTAGFYENVLLYISSLLHVLDTFSLWDLFIFSSIKPRRKFILNVSECYLYKTFAAVVLVVQVSMVGFSRWVLCCFIVLCVFFRIFLMLYHGKC